MQPRNKKMYLQEKEDWRMSGFPVLHFKVKIKAFLLSNALEKLFWWWNT